MSRSVVLWIAVVVLAGTLIFQGGDIYWSDGEAMYQVARSIVEDHDVAVDQGTAWPADDGRWYSPFGLGLSLLAVPVYAAIVAARAAVPVPEWAAHGLVSLLMPLIVACLAAAVYVLSRRLGAPAAPSAVAAVGSVFGTYILVYSKTFTSEPLTAVFLTVSIERMLARRPLVSGAAAAGAALTRPQSFLFAPVVVVAAWRQEGFRAALRTTAPIAAAAAVQVVYNIARWGDPTNFGYTNTAPYPQTFSTPLLEGTMNLLFHPDKSLLLFAPVVILVPFGMVAVWRRHRLAFWLIAANIAITWVLSATWWDWGGGFIWGPRLLLPAVPTALATIPVWVGGASKRARAMATLFALGFIMNLPGALISGGGLGEPPEVIGPRITRAYRLVPQEAIYTLHHLFDRARDGAQVLRLWQVGVGWRLGSGAFGIAIAVTVVLVLITLFALRRLVRSVRDASGRGSDVDAAVV
jgi:hypothetical protein